MHVVDAEFDQGEIKNCDTEPKAWAVISKVSIPIDFILQKADAIFERSTLEKESKLPCVIIADGMTDPDHCLPQTITSTRVFLLIFL